MWMIYGANGYTGELAAREAARRGLKPILAGRNAEAIGKLASELGLPQRVFGLEAPQLVERKIKLRHGDSSGSGGEEVDEHAHQRRADERDEHDRRNRRHQRAGDRERMADETFEPAHGTTTSG